MLPVLTRDEMRAADAAALSSVSEDTLVARAVAEGSQSEALEVFMTALLAAMAAFSAAAVPVTG